jgi:hypothetical protein
MPEHESKGSTTAMKLTEYGPLPATALPAAYAPHVAPARGPGPAMADTARLAWDTPTEAAWDTTAGGSPETGPGGASTAATGLSVLLVFLLGIALGAILSAAG